MKIFAFSKKWIKMVLVVVLGVFLVLFILQPGTAMKYGWTPSAKQWELYKAKERYINAKGDPRAGKSEGFFHKARYHLIKQPGIKILITRDSGTPLLRITFKHLFEKQIITPNMILGGMDGIQFKPYPLVPLVNGSEIHFNPYDEMDTTKGGGGEFGIILIDEAHRFSRYQWEYMDTRLSQQFGNGIRPDGVHFINPIIYNGLWTTQNIAGRGYLYQIFQKEHPLAYHGGDGKYRGFIFLLRDNPHLKPEYVKSMEEKPEHIRAKFLGGEDAPTTGLCFPDFDRKINTLNISKPYIPPAHWRILGGEDYGFQTAFVFLFACVTDHPRPFVIVFREYRTSHKTIPTLCKEVLDEAHDIYKKGASWIETARIDPSTNMRDGKSVDSKTVYELHREQGMEFLFPAARQKVMDRISRLRDMLEPDPLKTTHPITGEHRDGGWPTLIFLTGLGAEGGTCEKTVEEFEEWELKEETNREKVAEVPEEKNDHGPDAASYLMQAFWGDPSPEDPKVKFERENNPTEVLKREMFDDIEVQLSKGIPTRQTGDMVL